MRIRFLGAARAVTGSMHLIETNNRRILLDCGLFQGKRQEAFEKNRNLRIEGKDVPAVILSHAHIDHSGNLPTLIRSGFTGRIFATRATVDLANVMLRDSARIQVRDVEYLQRKKREYVHPLYEPQHARATVRRMKGVSYGRWFNVVPGVRARFQDAGHILGSASIHLEVSEPGEQRVRVTFTGDLGRPGLPILRDPDPLPEAEVVITESTYGNRCHAQDGPVADQMKDTLEAALLLAARGGGKLIIPAFAVGRTQNILYFLNELMAEGRIPTARVFIDSPLATTATEIIRRHAECFDEETLAKISGDLRPLLPQNVELVRSARDSKLINKIRGTSVIISASGMCEFGRILHHLKNNIEDPNSVIAFVGYQAHHTLGRRLVEGADRVRIYGKEKQVKAHVVKLNGFSAHADKNELLAALRPLRSAAGQTFVVHGDEEPALAFAKTLEGDGFRGVEVPSEGDSCAV